MNKIIKFKAGDGNYYEYSKKGNVLNKIPKINNIKEKKFQTNKSKGIYRGRMLSRNMTKHEKILANKLNEFGIIYWPQKSMYDYNGCYICDFYLENSGKKNLHLVIEVDGKSHDKQKVYDRKRTKWLNEEKSCDVIRFSNDEIENNIEKIIDIILSYPVKSLDNFTLSKKYIDKYNKRFKRVK
jgi:very-short-patch-repair endonuclease